MGDFAGTVDVSGQAATGNRLAFFSSGVIIVAISAATHLLIAAKDALV
jgi:hypothetical protein